MYWLCSRKKAEEVRGWRGGGKESANSAARERCAHAGLLKLCRVSHQRGTCYSRRVKTPLHIFGTGKKRKTAGGLKVDGSVMHGGGFLLTARRRCLQPPQRFAPFTWHKSGFLQPPHRRRQQNDGPAAAHPGQSSGQNRSIDQNVQTFVLFQFIIGIHFKFSSFFHLFPMLLMRRWQRRTCRISGPVGV